jgi:hypothetical protein
LRDFPEDARREAGHELWQVQKVPTRPIGSRSRRLAQVCVKSESAT